MRREVTLEEISDGRRYHGNDMVRLVSNQCAGCDACCKGMGNSIYLDPYDCYNLRTGLNCNFESLLAEKLVLNVYDGLILPHLNMIGEDGHCVFLGQEADGAMKGRCLIHEFRPGICRLYPLGRVYEGNAFSYFYQPGECRSTQCTKMKISKWVAVPGQKTYDEYICQWHRFTRKAQEWLLSKSAAGDDAAVRQRNMDILKHFYFCTYDAGFYDSFREKLRLAECEWNWE